MTPDITVRSADGALTWGPFPTAQMPIPRIGEALHLAYEADLWRVLDVVYRMDPRDGCYGILVLVSQPKPKTRRSRT